MDVIVERPKIYNKFLKLLSNIFSQYKRRHMSLSIDERPVVTPAMTFEEKGGKLNIKEQ